MSSFEKYSILIQTAAAVGTLMVAALAIWGDAIRSVLAAPRLEIKLRSLLGELTKFQDGTPARYYHIIGENARRWAPARNVAVYLTQVEQPAPDGSWLPIMPSGPVALAWQFGRFFPGLPAIGPERICDLFRVTPGNGIELQTQYTPNNLEKRWRGPCKLRLHVMAFADNAQSPELIVEVAWDGVWHEGAAEMATHLVAKGVKGEPAYIWTPPGLQGEDR